MRFSAPLPRPIVVKWHALVAGLALGPMFTLAYWLSVLNHTARISFYHISTKKVGRNGTKVLQARTSGNPRCITVGTQQK